MLFLDHCTALLRTHLCSWSDNIRMMSIPITNQANPPRMRVNISIHFSLPFLYFSILSSYVKKSRKTLTLLICSESYSQKTQSSVTHLLLASHCLEMLPKYLRISSSIRRLIGYWCIHVNSISIWYCPLFSIIGIRIVSIFPILDDLLIWCTRSEISSCPTYSYHMLQK